jgi:C4-dicarboxylate transporter DctM subunit
MIILTGLLLVALALLGAPLFAVIAAGAIFSFYRAGIDLSVVPIEIYRLAEMPVLLAIPLFTFAGYLLSESRAPSRLVRLSQALLGWMPGGFAIIALAASALFTAFNGASGVTIIALGALLYPALREAGYSERFSLGLIATSGSLGVLFAPALPLILYGVIAQQLGVGGSFTIDDLFLAGIFPCLLMLFLLSCWSIWQNRGQPLQPFSAGEARDALLEAIWELPLPIIVLGGIYSGYFAVSEAAAATTLYVIVVEVFIYREIALSEVPRIMRESMVLVGAIMVILGASLASTNAMIDAQIPTRLFTAIREYITNPFTFLALLNVFLLMLGTMLDIFSALVIMVPVLLPIAAGYGIDPVHLGIIFLANMQIGYFTPPVGMDLFLTSYRFEKSILEIYRATLPFFIILLLALLIITYWPALSLTLPGR